MRDSYKNFIQLKIYRCHQVVKPCGDGEGKVKSPFITQT